MPLIIQLFGPDGSGKSTLAKLFRSYLFSQGVYAHISWFRGSHLLASMLARFFLRFAAFKGSSNPYYGVTIPSRLRSIWLLIEFFSILPHYLLRKFLSLSHHVIGDRGVLDFIVWIIVTLDHPKFLTSLLGRFLARLATKDISIYITTDPTVLRKRAPNTPRPFLLKEEACYKILAKYYANHIIDTTDKTPKETLGELLRYLREL
ncbi:MAG: thymidylate kinase [Candidatus Bathyarchaeia archaeon]